MIDEDPKTQGFADGSDAAPATTQGDDTFPTRCPEEGDEFATRADAGSTTWSDPSQVAYGQGGHSAGSLRYRILRTHARGALGEVFLARDEELKREVALKEIQEKYADDPCSRSRFVVEAEVTGGLEHPGIVPVYGLGYHPDGRPYYAMRFVRGGTLKEAIDRYHQGVGPRPDPGEQALAFRKLLAKFLGVCNAIAYAHSRQVLHRDLKPGNIMLGAYGETLVVDWGLARSMDEPGEPASFSGMAEPPGPLRPISGESSSPSATQMGAVVGTPAFMSPEQAEGDLDRLGAPSDIYSLGATLYYLLTGKVAFQGRDVNDILRRVREGSFPPPGKVCKGVPRALEAICLKAMSLRPEDRYANAKALATDVEHWMAGASVSAYRDWKVVKLWRWALRRPILATAGISCLFFDLCLLVILLLLYVQSVLKINAAWMPELNLAAGVLVLVPFVGQLGALIGSSLGAVVGLATRRTLLGLERGAGVGLKFGVAMSLLILLVYGGFVATHPPSWTNLASWITDEDWPRLPGAVTRAPRWINKKTGTPVEIAVYFDQPPLEDNAARGYLDALIEFDDGMAPCFPPADGIRRASIALARKERLRKFEKAWKVDPSTVEADALDALLDEYAVGFLKLEMAQTKHRCSFQTGLGDKASLPHAEAAREVERVAVFRVARELDRREIEAAIKDLRVVLRLCRDIRSRGVLSTQITSLESEARTETDILLPILRHPALSADDCEQILAILQGHASEGLDPFLEGLRAEYVKFGQILHVWIDPKIAEDRNDPAKGSLDEKTLTRLERMLAKAVPRDFVDAAHRAYDEFHKTIHAYQGKTLLERIEHANQQPPLTMAPHHHQVLQLAPDVGSLLRAIARAETTRNAMKCLVALRHWELKGQPFSEGLSLEEVVNASGMAKVPPDPYRIDGGPLKLRIDPAGPIIESVGPTGRDNLRPGLSYRLKPTVDGR